ncbi:hypothetical protein K788_0004796 [Paraburkholderia caribensis MBA4]|uniref:Uncharacterized protein n=1 Tax=Paraburkholderia caribensis MBA4 TaxID=1323664 RepID=A0A0P0R774_9BURK|nr:hypothetical protein K788_0004796 [Paraburkholderia caribensis MBA4]
MALSTSGVHEASHAAVVRAPWPSGQVFERAVRGTMPA